MLHHQHTLFPYPLRLKLGRTETLGAKGCARCSTEETVYLLQCWKDADRPDSIEPATHNALPLVEPSNQVSPCPLAAKIWGAMYSI
jgi:hypothetical protein